MDVIPNSIIPFPNYFCCNLFGFIFARQEKWAKASDFKKETAVNHESIHTAQIDDFGLIFFWCKPLQRLFGGILFYFFYILEWIYWLIWRTDRAYRHINFEKEAYAHQRDPEYLKHRKHFAQWRK